MSGKSVFLYEIEEEFSLKELETVAIALNDLAKSSNENDYQFIMKISDKINGEIESIESFEDEEEYEIQCRGCGSEIMGGHICRDCSGV